jgi:hypothetical protein
MGELHPDSPMPIPPHVQKQLQQALGSDAGEDFVAWTEEVDTARGDIAELRHEMQIGFARLEAHIDRRITEATRWFMTWIIVALGVSFVAMTAATTAVVIALSRR